MNSTGSEKNQASKADLPKRNNPAKTTQLVNDADLSPASAAEPVTKSRGSIAKRRRNARQKAMQALYQWDFDSDGNSVTDIVDQFCQLQNMERVDVDYFKEVFLFVVKNLDSVDRSIVDHIDRPMERLDPVERSVLRVACSEFMCRLDIPYKIIVNEALEITKLFGADQGHKFVNGVVDKMAAELRPVEYQADNSVSNASPPEDSV